MNKITKAALALTALFSVGAIHVSAKTLTADEIHEASTYHIEGLEDASHLEAYVFGRHVLLNEFYLADIIDASGVATDKVLYYKDASNVWVDAIKGTQLDEEKLSFDVDRIIGSVNGEKGHVSSDSSLYSSDYITSEALSDGRTADIFGEDTEPSTVSYDINEVGVYGSDLISKFGFNINNAYGKDGIKIVDGVLTGVIKKHHEIDEKFMGSNTGYYLDFIIKVPGANDKTVVYLNGKEVKYTDFDIKGNTGRTAGLNVLLELNPEATNKIYKFSVDLDGKETKYGSNEYSFDWSGLKFEKESSAEFTVEGLKDLSATGFDASKANITINASEEKDAENEYNITGNIYKQEEITIDDAEPVENSYYIAYGIKIDTEKYPNATLKVDREEYSASDFTNNVLTIMKLVTSGVTNKIVIKVDLDGNGEEYTEVTYTLDYSKLVYGANSEITVADVGYQTYLKTKYKWEKPEGYNITFSEPDKNNVIKATGFIPYISKANSSIPFSNKLGYFMGMVLEVNSDIVMNSSTSTVSVTCVDGTTDKASYKYSDFSTNKELYVLAHLDPATKNANQRNFEITIDIDGASKDEYAATTYTIDWSGVKFSETSAASLTLGEKASKNDTLKLTVLEKTYTLNGDVHKRSTTAGKTDTGYSFIYDITPIIKTALNPLTSEIPNSVEVTVSEGEDDALTYKKTDFIDGKLSITKYIDPSDDGEKTINIKVDLDGEAGKAYEPVEYTLNYASVKLVVNGESTVDTVRGGDITDTYLNDVLGYGYDASKTNVELVSSKNGKNEEVIYAQGYVLEQELDYAKETYPNGVFGSGKDKGYYVPIRINLNSAENIESFEFTSSAKTINASDAEFAKIIANKRLDILRLVSTDGKEITNPIFEITIKYKDSDTEEGYSNQTIKFDFSGLSLGVEGVYEDAYNKTSVRKLDTTELTTVKFGNSQTQEFNDLVDYLDLLAPANDMVVTNDVAEHNDVLTHLLVTFNTETMNSRLNKFGFANVVANAKNVVFKIAIDEKGYLVSADAEIKGEDVAGNTILTYGSKEKPTTNTVQEINLHYVINSHSRNTTPTVTFEEGKTLPEQSEAFDDKFYNKPDYSNQDKTLDQLADAEFKNIYTEVGYVDITNVDHITINDVEYDDSLISISVGNNGHLNVPVFVVVKNTLYVSNVYLMLTNSDVAKVTYGDFTFTINTGITPANAKLSILNVDAYNNAEDNIVSFEGNVITQIASHGNNGIGIKLTADGKTAIVDSTKTVYVLHENGNVGVTSANDKGFTYAIYLQWNNGSDFTVDNKNVSSKTTLVIPGYGSIDIELNQYVVVLDVE